MENFSDYINKTEPEVKKNNKLNTEDLEKLIDKYSEYESDALLKEFLKMTLERKKQGNLKDSELENVKQTITPYLDSNQKQSLEKLLDMIKNVWENWQKINWKNKNSR